MSLVTLKEVLEIAERTNTAIPGFNIDNIEIPEAIMEAAEVENCPVILTIGQGAINAGGLRHLPDVVRRIAESSRVPVVMHLDHGISYEQAITCLRAGFTSVMYDGSHHPFEENVRESQALESEADKQKFTDIYEQYHPQMEQTALRILKNQHDAEDAVQNAFMQIIRHFEKIDEIPCEKLPFWIVCIVKNEAVTILRKNQRTVQLENWDSFAADAESVTDYLELVQLFSRLPETYRAVLEMRLLLGYTGKEIARHLALSESAVNTRIFRGRALLREIAEKEAFYA